MTSLRRRLILLLVASIVGVVGLATAAVISVRGGGPPPELIMPWVAQQMELVVRLLPSQIPDVLPVQLSDHPAGGRVDRDETAMLNDILRRRGLDVLAVVNDKAGEPGQLASVRLHDNRWAIIEVPHITPPKREWLVLAGWISLIVAGATAVSVYFTSVLIRPVEMLEAAVSKIGSDGVLAAVPEVGSAEVKATAHALNQLSSRLKTAMESRMRLVAAAGHDLRTPMTRMRLRAEFLAGNEEREKWLHDLDELDRIADSAIRLVREEVDQDAVEPVELDRLVRDIEAEMVSLGHAVSVGHLDKVSVRAGALGLRRALRNLIVNAATHGKGCGISLSAADNRATLTIADRGPGIPPELLGKAFEPFFRVDPGRRQSIPGAGLGLAIAKEIIERHGGAITLENRPGGGLSQKVVFDAVS
ncbi:MAG: HAMP domain-containing protein [Mesorhizobium sp.]|uniref:ATP-binding protein n=2 Tax=Mesorhizobium TaxID=68287 RepID=UPI0007ED42A1|nr:MULTISPECIES: ATP-binding protein [unclassified Mesorhizobium]QIA21223.1 HAMP domain-containing protein [Mesorhizobium sp. AA22]RWD39514.1 MAG: HAMP domain-containing protein [Mesorhizobium sp.]RWE06624.1 MAG: HAMP domain-containing protein [Mesorhizobium sp.]RWE51868.1 MAG: HAMP domain-containing protein [Mesorhizobium sp.]RWE83877.1 MAG: HAMP domain-containing protein [Mesorhizobium sp.]